MLWTKKFIVVKFVCISIFLLLVISCASFLYFTRFNNMNGIEKTLKQIYNIDTATIPHKSDIISVNVALDRDYTNFKLVLNIDLTKDRNLIIRDFDGYLKHMQLQKIGVYTLLYVTFNPTEIKTDERLWWSFHGMDLSALENISGLNLKTIDDIISKYDVIYDYINNLPEMARKIDDAGKIIQESVVLSDGKEITINNYEEIFGMNDKIQISVSNSGEKYVVFKRKWDQKDLNNYLTRIGKGNYGY